MKKLILLISYFFIHHNYYRAEENPTNKLKVALIQFQDAQSDHQRMKARAQMKDAISRGADISDELGCRILHEAVQQQDEGLVRFLTDQGIITRNPSAVIVVRFLFHKKAAYEKILDLFIPCSSNTE